MSRRSAPGQGAFKSRCHPLTLQSDPRSSCCRGYSRYRNADGVSGQTLADRVRQARARSRSAGCGSCMLTTHPYMEWWLGGGAASGA